MVDCIFCKIVAKQIPSQIIFENDDVLAFLDINPARKGHTLVIPKNHYETIDKVPGYELHAVMDVVQKIGLAVKEATRAEGFNVLQSNGRVAGQIIDHVHFHIIPRKTKDELSFEWKPAKYIQGEIEIFKDEIKQKLVK